MDVHQYREAFAPTFHLGYHPRINHVEEVLQGHTQAYVIFPTTHGDMHSYVRRKRKLREREAAALFHQMVQAVAHCHTHGVVLRDLKLRKFVFKKEGRYVSQRIRIKTSSLLNESVIDFFHLSMPFCMKCCWLMYEYPPNQSNADPKDGILIP